MDLVARLVKHSQKRFDRYLKTFQSRKWIINSIEQIWKNKDFESRKDHNKKLTDFFNFQEYLPQADIDILRKNNFSTINYFYREGKSKPEYRGSGEPYPIHSIDVQYILRAVEAPTYALIAGMNHDNVEHRIEEEKKQLKLQKKDISKESLDEILDKVVGEQLNRLLSHSTPETNHFDLAKSVIIMQKVTRFESDENYYQSIDRIFSKNITPNTPGLKTFFDEYLSKFGELNLNNQILTDIIEAAAAVKLADRIANTLDHFKEQKTTDKLRVIYKNMYVINKAIEYLEMPRLDKYSKTSMIMKELVDTLIDINHQSLQGELEDFLQKQRFNPFFLGYKPVMDRNLNDYIKNEGFISVDYGFDNNQYSGILRSVWDRIIRKDVKIESKIEDKPREQYVAITGLLEINNIFSKGKAMHGFADIGKDHKLGYYDDMGEKYSSEWKEKKKVRENHGVKSTESFYSMTSLPLDYRETGV